MSQSTPPGPRHARPVDVETPAGDGPTTDLEPPTGEIPTVIPGEFTDDSTQILPVIPRQRTAPPADVEPPRHIVPSVYPVAAAAPTAPRRRRVLPAVLAGVTACLLAGGVFVGVSGLAESDADAQPSVSTTP